ncbi:MAG: hypothetical protein R6X10_09810 [Desulfobacterales bacterium]
METKGSDARIKSNPPGNGSGFRQLSGILKFNMEGVIMGKKYRPIKPGKKWFKALIAKIVFMVLGRAFQSGARHDSDIKKEVSAWPEGFIIIMNVLPFGPRMAMKKINGRLKYRGTKYDDGDLVVNFKNLECAFLVLTPQIGSAQAFAERRMTVKGDIAYAMAFTRCLNTLLTLLYPKFICKRLLKRVPPLTLKKMMTKVVVNVIGVPFGL